MSIMDYNGAAVIAMTGKNCVAIASDLRFGVQHQTVGMNFPKIFKINEKTYLGLSGLATDIQTIVQKLKFRTNMYKLREEREIKPSTFGSMLSSMLYERRFGPYFAEPVVAGLEGPDNKPFITAMDLIGASVDTDEFVVGGTCNESLYGTCESFWKPDMEPDELFEVISQCLLASVDRDCLSGWGGVVHVITPKEVICRELKGRQD